MPILNMSITKRRDEGSERTDLSANPYFHDTLTDMGVIT